MRTTELLELTAGQVLAGQHSNEVVLDLGYTKSGKRKGVRELVVLDEPYTVAVLKAALLHCDPHALLIRSSAAHGRRNFNRFV